MCVVKLNLKNQVGITILGIYRPPNLSIADFLNEFSDVYANNFSNCGSTFVVGDINIDILPGSSVGLDWSNLLECWNFSPLITQPTRVCQNSSTGIDHIWVNFKNHFTSYIFETSITDHYTIISYFPIFEKKLFFKKYFRDYSADSINNFIGKVEEWLQNSEVIVNQNLDACIDRFNDKLYEIFDSCCKIRCKQISNNRIYKPWINASIISLIRYKDTLYRLHKHGKIPHYILKNFKNNLGSIISQSRKLFINKKFENEKDSKAVWKNVNSLTRLGKSVGSKYDISIHKDDKILNTGETVEEFGVFFSQIAKTLDDKIPQSPVSPLSFLGPRMENSFFVRLSSPNEVFSIIMKSKNKKGNLKEIPVFIYKLIAHLISPIISNWFNASVNYGFFPSSFKIARITPIFKSGCRNDVKNFRPISILPYFSKNFERLMYNRLYNYFIKFKIFCSHQFGFRTGLSTGDAILEFLDGIYQTLDDRALLIATFLDFSKAFDTVNHEVLIKKLKHYGVRGAAVNWFSSYLGSRYSYVCIDNIASKHYLFGSGVPQGSVLGSLLFLVYINDMYRSCNSCHLVHFADDTTVYRSSRNLPELLNGLNTDLNCISVWLRANRLTLNVDKSSYMFFGNITDGTGLSLSICNQELNIVHHVKFLGVLIDDRLTFKLHYEEVIKKLSRVCGVLWSLKTLLPAKTMLLIYYSLGWSYITYAISAWGRSSMTYISKLQAIQNRIMRIIFGSSSVDVFKTNGILTINNAYDYFSSIKLYKDFNYQTTKYFTDKILEFQSSHNYETRFRVNGNLIIPRFTSARGQKSFIFQSVVFWNTLPLSLKNSPDLRAFKKLLKSFILDSN